jgi:hypothetical protein
MEKVLGISLRPLIGIEYHLFLNQSTIIPYIAISSLPVNSREERFKYIVSLTNFKSRDQFAFIASHAIVKFASNLVEDSEFLVTKPCLLSEEILASTLVQSVPL